MNLGVWRETTSPEPPQCIAQPGLAYRLLAYDSKASRESQQGRTLMARAVRKQDDPDSSMKIKGAELATRIFSLVMLGVCVVLLLMIIFGDW